MVFGVINRGFRGVGVSVLSVCQCTRNPYSLSGLKHGYTLYWDTPSGTHPLGHYCKSVTKPNITLTLA